jgi:hypothetical protein
VSEKQALKDKLDSYLRLLDKLDDVDSSLDDVDSTMRNIMHTEPRACDLSPLLQVVGDALSELLEAARERSNELENELDALDALSASE